MSGKIFVIADLHFGHSAVSSLRGFDHVDDHDDALIDAWNSVVREGDVVYVLGDVFNPEPLSRCAGIKKLILGNHDKETVAKYLETFSKVYAMHEIRGVLLTHIPVHPGQAGRYRLNVHGHLHTLTIADKFYRNVSVEQCPNFAPRLLSEVIA